MTKRYILKGKIPVPCEDLMEWAKRLEGADRKVKLTKTRDIQISTVFLGLDHQFGDGPPLLFETMVFGGQLDGEMNRYSTWDDAVKGHKEMVRRAKGRKEA